MNVQTVAQTGTGQSDAVKILGHHNFKVGFGVVVSGTVTYTVQHTFDGSNWFDHDATDLVDAVANQDGNYAYPVAGIRVNVTAGTGSVTLTTIQAVR
jgi:archaellum component FlaF (FlaF/FlaG flagellin family)